MSQAQVRRLTALDAALYQEVRVEGVIHHADCFRISEEDERAYSLNQVAQRLDQNFVLGGFIKGVLSGIAGFSVLPGTKASHKGLLWGMYVRKRAQGTGLADEMIRQILKYAQTQVEQVQLTVLSENVRACRVYDRWGFRVFGVEPRSVKIDGKYFDEQHRVLIFK